MAKEIRANFQKAIVMLAIVGAATLLGALRVLSEATLVAIFGPIVGWLTGRWQWNNDNGRGGPE